MCQSKREGLVGGEQRYEGRLELTWTNKDLRLLARDDGRYTWVPPADYRVAEVRLLGDAGTVGAVAAPDARARDNLLIRGDALNALHSLAALPEFAREYLGKVKLAYLDPPFNTQQSFLHYDDALEHSVWLTMMRDRLLQVKALLSDDGSVWVHCDDSEIAAIQPHVTTRYHLSLRLTKARHDLSGHCVHFRCGPKDYPEVEQRHLH
jgi:adenine-specific DNA-methyltransferase